MSPFELLGGASRLIFFRKRHPERGARPGTIVPAQDDPIPTSISLTRYTTDAIDEHPDTDIAQLREQLQREGVLWVDVQGLNDGDALQQLRDIFALHPLAIEDAVNVPQRPKYEPYEGCQLFLTRIARQAEDDALDIEQVSIFIGERYVLTLQERHGDVFGPVRNRLRAGQGPIRRSGSDYLAYAIIDAVLDGYYPVVENIGERLHDLEEEIFDRPTPGALRRIHGIRRELLALRRAVWPQREAVAQLMRPDNERVSDLVRQYLRDCHDHAVQINDVIETYREFAANLMDLYLSGIGQRTNEVMKVLTVMASIFIPLTFLAGLYGMNFSYIPELSFRWAYPSLLALMLVIAVIMLWYFHRRGWLGTPRGDEE
jgi:magnesium transporter